MNPLQEVLSSIDATVTEFTGRMNTAIQGMGPIEQYEVAQKVSYALNEMLWGKKRIEEMGEMLGNKLGDVAEFVASLEAKQKEAGVTAALAAGEVVNKTDHDTQIKAAKDAARNEALIEFKAEREKERKAGEAHAALAEEVGDVAASAFPVENFLEEDADSRVKAFKARVAKLDEAKIKADAHKDAYLDLLGGCSYDETGEAAFARRVESYAPFLAGKEEAPAEEPKKKPGTELQGERGGLPPSEQAPKKAVLI